MKNVKIIMMENWDKITGMQIASQQFKKWKEK